MDRDVLRRPLYLVAFLGLLLVYFTAYDYLLTPNEGADAGSCRVVSMYPSFARIRSFDQSHTKFASKFSLYLYREQGKDPIPKEENEGFQSLDGIPALFIPGNAGSYRQMRSIAAEISNLYFDDNIHVVTNPNARNFDFFTADFNEDFTAFHGRTMLDQAEFLNEAIRFILLLYLNTSNPPTSVIIVAHSMGGIVARVMPTLPNYVLGSINTIVTLSSPHSAAPLTFDGDILKIYLAIDRFWLDAFEVDPNSLGVAHLRLKNVSLVSITGGLLDSVLPADYTTLGFLVPPSNGFAVYTTGIPDVWTPMDHLAIMWCRQLRRQLLRMLLELVDVTSPHRTYPLEKRMPIMRRHLLSGFESYSKNDRLPPGDADDHIILRFDNKESVRGAFPRYIWKSNESKDLVTSIPLLVNSTILIVSDTELDQVFSSKGVKILLCRKEGKGTRTLDLTTLATNEYIELVCADLSDQTNFIPRSAKDVGAIEESSFDGHKLPFHALRLNPEDFQGYEELVILDTMTKLRRKKNFVIVERSHLKDTQYNLAKDMFTLITRGADISLLPSSPLAINLHISGAWSSILSYRLELRGLQKLLDGSFEPFMRQWKEEPYETKWHINLNSRRYILISMHGIAPYTPFNQMPDTRGLNLELWKDPQLDMNENEIETIDVVLKVDWANSLKLLVLRYRLATISQCLAITVLATMFQFAQYFSSGTFPDYIFGLLKVTQRNVMVPILIILILLTPLTKLRAVQTFLNVIDPVVLHDPNELNLSLHDDFTLNSFFLGLQELVLSGVSWVFFTMGVGLNFLLYYALQFIGIVVLTAASLVLGVFSRIDNTQQRDVDNSLRRKFVTTALIVCAVLFYLPYQFAYMVSFVIQVVTTVKSMAHNRTRSMWNYHISFLMMMLWVLPINVPVLVVFVHNLNIQWNTPFSSHHNFMAVAPIVALSEVHSFFPESMPFGGENKQRISKKVFAKVTFAILGYTVFYCTMYGARHTFWLHHLFNIWCSWLLIGFLDHMYSPQNEKSK
ncbi:CIC11C00000003596 [Sungouiella intermedia]|uniref:GPI inositol-deacylase n=1 Tax=Sungouiella intermedia TaxID=45354 RepID=A0A1L0GI20_9ASCO|nr:CIC11C00000003596 [[Candida] intermedia]